jgi:hypothetical protein
VLEPDAIYQASKIVARETRLLRFTMVYRAETVRPE